ncbi:MAG: hypothetical protein DWB56_06720 [Candidatus Jettenia sp.]|nr:MAG: hypothetical protein EDM77_03660 [Candidatus Jettenia sp. AMX1]MBC6928646.1 hypothetical protein [Candidatus Jettenia sp.]MCE7879958.1 hypothetical protein [Candidatus Jettenia sp. AMX1]MCQ3926740.1 hypothetical protein [Candidatus Jettenia sp.]
MAKIESVEGTAETLANADGGILAIDPKVDVDIKMHARNPVMATLSRLADVAGAQLARLTFKVEIKGPGAAYSASVVPALAKYLRACGFAETLDVTPGSEKATYKPASTGAPCLTIGCYEDGVIKQLVGARGNVKFTGKAGEPVFAEFDFLGVWGGLTDGAMLTPTYESTIPPVFLSASFTIAAYSAILAGIDIDMANTLHLRNDVNKPAGYLSTVITNRDPNGKFDPEMALVATHDWYGRWKGGTTGALSLGNIGSTQYNRYKITAPKVVYRKVSDAEREGVVVADTAFQLAMNTGDDEVVLEFS